MTLSELLFDKGTYELKINKAFDLLEKAMEKVPSIEEDISEKTERFLQNIELSEEQQKVAKMNSTHLLVKGSAGSGKSITLLTRMMQKMSEDFGKRFLFVSFSQELVKDAGNRFFKSKYHDALQKHGHEVQFMTFHELAYRLLKSMGIEVKLFQTSHRNLNHKDNNTKGMMLRILNLLDTEEFEGYPSIHTIKKTKNTAFLMDEFAWMKGNGFISKDDYLTCERKGRGKLPNLSAKQRITIYRLFEIYREEQQKDFKNRIDREDYALLIMENLHKLLNSEKFDHIFIDEVQDLQPMQLRLLVAINKGTLTLSGDERQRIYKSSPFSYQSLGIKVQSGNNVVLKRNWRSTYQIMKLANSLNFNRSDEDSKYDDEKYFPRQGEKPLIRAFKSYKDMLTQVGKQIMDIRKSKPDSTFAIIHRQHDIQKERDMKTFFGRFFSTNTYIKKINVNNATRHVEEPKIYYLEAKATKGLEFDYVFILDFSIFYYPHKDEIDDLEKIKQFRSEAFLSDKKEIEEKEKRILYVSLTRTKQEAFLYFVASEDPEKRISTFVKDFSTKDYIAKGFSKTKV